MRTNLRFTRKLAIALILAAVASTISHAEDLDPVTQLVMPTPYELTAFGSGPAEITVTWKDVSRTESAFELQWTTDPVHGEWWPATEKPLTSVTAGCSRNNTGAVPTVTPDAPDGNVLNPYLDPDPARCFAILKSLRNRSNTASIQFPYAQPATTEYWFRIRNLMLYSLPGVGPAGATELPKQVQTLIHSPWSGYDPAILGPLPPTNLQAYPTIPTVTLAWANQATGDPHFRENEVERRIGGRDDQRVTLPATASTYFDGPLAYDTTYSYRVFAKRVKRIPKPGDPNTGAGPVPDHDEMSYSASSGLSQAITVTTPPIPAPANPTGLLASFSAPAPDCPNDAACKGSANLLWMDNSTDEDGFLIEFGPADGDWRAQTAVGPHQGTGFVAFSQHGISPDTIRFFRVFAYRVTPYAKSDPTNSASITAIPKAPSSLVQQTVTSFSTTLAFRDNSATESGFQIEWCDPTTATCGDAAIPGWNAIPLTLPASPGTGQTLTFVDGRFANTTLKYRARAFNASGGSAPSNVVSSTTPNAPLNAPSNLLALADVNDPHRVSMTWQDNTNGDPADDTPADDQEEAFRIEYQDPGRPWQTLTSVGVNVTSYIDTTVPGMRTRCYRVRAVRSSDNRISDPSNTSCATTVSGPRPLPPRNLVARPWDCTPRFTSEPVPKPRCNWRQVVELTWEDQSAPGSQFDETSWVIEHSTDASTWLPLATAAANTTLTRLSRHFEPSSVHYFRMKAINLNGESAYSNVARVQLLGPPRPVWLNPAKDGTLATTACSIDGTFTVGFNPPVEDIMVQIVRKIGLDSGTYTCYSTPGSCKYDKATPIPEIPNQPNQVQMNWNGPGTFKLNFHFRKNVTYELHAFAINDDGSSADALISTFVVAADCPLGGGA